LACATSRRRPQHLCARRHSVADAPLPGGAGTTAFGFKARHARADAVFLGDSIGGNDDAIASASTTDPDRPFLQFRIEGDFTARKEAVAINVKNAVGWFHVAPPTLFCQPQFPSKQVEKSYSQGAQQELLSCSLDAKPVIGDADNPVKQPLHPNLVAYFVCFHVGEFCQKGRWNTSLIS
jgi:hypothetical protein